MTGHASTSRVQLAALVWELFDGWDAAALEDPTRLSDPFDQAEFDRKIEEMRRRVVDAVGPRDA